MTPIKRVAVTLVVSALAVGLFALAGCASAPSPTETVESAFSSLKSGDFEKFSASYAGDTDSLKEALSSSYLDGEAASIDSLTDDQKAIVEKFVKLLFSYDFAVSNETIDGDSATVVVDFESYDMASIIKGTLSEYLTKALGLALSSAFQVRR